MSPGLRWPRARAADLEMPADREIIAAYRGVRVLVTGASGFIGRWVARLLSEAEADLWMISRDIKALDRTCGDYSIRGEKVEIDLLRPGAFRAVYRELKAPITFNLAGYGVDRSERDEALAWAVNARLVGEMAETIAEFEVPGWQGLQLVHVGSALEYGGASGLLSEACEPVPTTVYGKSKLEGTRRLQAVCQAKGLRAATARAFAVYGPGEHVRRLLPALMQVARSGGTLALTGGEQERDFTYVEDVAEGLLRLGLVAEVPKQVVNLATGRLTSVRSFVECAGELLGISRDQLLFGAIPYREEEMWRYRADISLLQSLLGWVPACSVRDGIKRTIDFAAVGERSCE